MDRILIAYTTEEGQTAKICGRIAERLAAHAFDPVIHNIRVDKSVPNRLTGAIVAGSVHLGAHSRALAAFVRDNREKLSALPSAFISVSLQSASPDADERDEVRSVAEDFLAETGFKPLFLHTAAGAVHDARIGPLRRVVLHWILRRRGVDLDPSGDTEFTDWTALDRFVDEYAHALRGEEELGAPRLEA
ncbi:flavodoxin domain-containing protein [Rhodobium gokarnense]|uniref:Menaquinone-dependent protoporphyrinogen oxidase n=1 Tax=Rhodobium gokarnense TaxID=364296 RepID=A0ABT3HCZ0_9HYPH|nr:flavodoxin domain-containing protein [Rhodobium gokarnense]MCW2308248.1 menaquinone-dependent protoporphyrinogen oxidase [Rhodobium gokarnense]